MYKVSIIVPIYNVEKYLDRCIQSLLNQTLKEIEIILVDDGSPDRCPQMCDEYARQDSRIKVIHKKNAGLGFARNSGLEIATGEYVAFVDSDDYVDVHMYEDLFREAQKNNYDIVYCAINNETINGDTEVLASKDEELTSRKEILNFLANMIAPDSSIQKGQTNDMCVWRSIYKKSLLDKYKIKFMSEREYLSEDILFHLQLLPYCKKIRSLPNAYCYHSFNHSSLTQTFKESKIDCNFSLYHKMLSIIKEENLPQLKQRLMTFFIGYTRGIILRGIIMAKNTSILHKRNLCNKIYSYPGWKMIFQEYPIRKMDFMRRFIMVIIRYRLFFLNYLLYKLYYSLHKD